MKGEKTNVQQARRRFLKSAGKLAIYTPPAMMVLAKPSLAQIVSSTGRAPSPNYRETHTSRDWYRDTDTLRMNPTRTRRIHTLPERE